MKNKVFAALMTMTMALTITACGTPTITEPVAESEVASVTSEASETPEAEATPKANKIANKIEAAKEMFNVDGKSLTKDEYQELMAKKATATPKATEKPTATPKATAEPTSAPANNDNNGGGNVTTDNNTVDEYTPAPAPVVENTPVPAPVVESTPAPTAAPTPEPSKHWVVDVPEHTETKTELVWVEGNMEFVEGYMYECNGCGFQTTNFDEMYQHIDDALNVAVANGENSTACSSYTYWDYWVNVGGDISTHQEEQTTEVVIPEEGHWEYD